MSSALGWLTIESAAENPPRRVWRDWLLAAIVAAAAGLEIAFRDDLHWPVVSLAFGLMLAWLMLYRRTYPLGTVALAFGVLIVLDIGSVLIADQPFSSYAGAFVLVLLYALFRWASPRAVATGVSFVVVEVAVIAVTDYTGLDDLFGGLSVLLIPPVLGILMRERQMAQAQRYEQVRTQERVLLARELHDTVAHHVSAIAVQAQAGRFLAGSGNAEGAASALEVIEREASSTLAEMRSVVGSLRREDRAPWGVTGHGLSDIEGLATTDEAHGIRVDVDLGNDVGDLSPPVQSALYRVAQESVTNAQRHARHATQVRVSICDDEHSVRMRVSDDGERQSVGHGSAGYGLVGMAERLALLGGTVQAGPAPRRGWLVTATIPKRGHAS